MHKLQEDNVFVGIIVSLFLTATMYYVFSTVNHNLTGDMIGEKEFGGFTDKFIAILAVFFNIVPFVIYMRTRKDDSMKGVGIVTVILSVFVMFYYFI